MEAEGLSEKRTPKNRGTGRVVSRAKFQSHLLFQSAPEDGAAAAVPNVEPVAVALEQDLRFGVLDHVRCATRS